MLISCEHDDCIVVYDSLKNCPMCKIITEIKKVEKALDEYEEKQGVTIRKFVESERYTGFTKQGVRIPIDHWKAFKALVDEVDAELK